MFLHFDVSCWWHRCGLEHIHYKQSLAQPNGQGRTHYSLCMWWYKCTRYKIRKFSSWFYTNVLNSQDIRISRCLLSTCVCISIFHTSAIFSWEIWSTWAGVVSVVVSTNVACCSIHTRIVSDTDMHRYTPIASRIWSVAQWTRKNAHWEDYCESNCKKIYSIPAHDCNVYMYQYSWHIMIRSSLVVSSSFSCLTSLCLYMWLSTGYFD